MKLAEMIGGKEAVPVKLRQAVVVGTPAGGMATIRLGGSADAADDISGVRHLASAVLGAGDTVWVLQSGGALLIIGTVAPSVWEPGDIKETARSAASPGWLLCDGASYPTTTYPALFAAIGYAYGGSGANFNVPNKKGRVGVGRDAADTDFDTLGETRGAKTHALSIAELAIHTHIQNPHQHQINSANAPVASVFNSLFQNSGNPPTGDGGDTVVATATNQNTGSGTAHNNIQPSIVVNYVIKT